jgi:hypothetical protein
MKHIKLFEEFINEAVELVHVYDTDGSMYGTGELVKTKGKKSLIRWDGSREEWYPSDRVELVESTIDEANAVNPKQKGIGKFLGSVKNTDVYVYEIFPKVMLGSSEFKNISLEDIKAIQALVYAEFTGMHKTTLSGKAGKRVKQHLYNLDVMRSKKDGSFDKPVKKQEFGGNFDKMAKTSTNDQLLRNFN